jgi:hypothetical protein
MPVRHHYRRVPHLQARFPGQVDLFTSFWLAAHWVWERRETAKRAGMPFSEETITDTVLLDLATQHPRELKIVPFNKRREGRTGADWEWCFYDLASSTFQPMLVQAKLLDDRDHEYSHIDRLIGSTGVRQIDRLLTTASRRRIPAIYMFYNHIDDRRRVPVHACKLLSCAECWGCSVALADVVRRVLPSKDFDVLKAHSRPWVCLLCEGQTTARGAPAKVLATLRDLYEQSRHIFRERDTPFENIVPPPQRPSSQPPPYFERLISIDGTLEPVEGDTVVARLAAENPDIDGIVLMTDGDHRRGD